jgi:hypothetical protein
MTSLSVIEKLLSCASFPSEPYGTEQLFLYQSIKAETDYRTENNLDMKIIILVRNAQSKIKSCKKTATLLVVKVARLSLDGSHLVHVQMHPVYNHIFSSRIHRSTARP